MGPPFGLHSQSEQQTQQGLCRSRKTACCPSSLGGRPGDSVHSWNRNPSPPLCAGGWPGFQKALCGAARRPSSRSRSRREGSCAVTPPGPSHSRGGWDRLLPILSFLLILGSGQNSAFSGVTGPRGALDARLVLPSWGCFGHLRAVPPSVARGKECPTPEPVGKTKEKRTRKAHFTVWRAERTLFP